MRDFTQLSDFPGRLQQPHHLERVDIQQYNEIVSLATWEPEDELRLEEYARNNYRGEVR